MSQTQSTFRFSVTGPTGTDVTDFWDELTGLLGIDEGTVLSDEAHELGFETEAWVLDSGAAPENRDWISDRSKNKKAVQSTLYFDSHENAENARELLLASGKGFQCGAVEEQKPQDWDAEWKASFQGIDVLPYFQILPPWVKPELKAGPPKWGKETQPGCLRINPGAGFGTGTHETTQLCLETLAEYASKISQDGKVRSLSGLTALDFGSGSGILAIGAALLGAQVDGVEIDELAIDNSVENTKMNSVEALVSYRKELRGIETKYPIVIANILRPVLLQFKEALLARWTQKGPLILSGLMGPDGEDVANVYSEALGRRPIVKTRGDWRALVWLP